MLANDEPSSKGAAQELAQGKHVFELQCARCHGMRGTGGTGANLTRRILRHAADDAAMFDVVKEGIPGTAMPGNWFLTDREIREVSRYVRSLSSAMAEPLPGDPKRGEQVFAKSDCTKCHIVRGRGTGVGPELTGIGAQRGIDLLRSALLDPSHQMPLDDQGYTAYRTVVAAGDDGRVVTGTRVNEDTFTIQLRDQENRIHSLEKKNLEALRKTDESLMPSYGKLLSPRDVDDLVSYLAGLQGPTP